MQRIVDGISFEPIRPKSTVYNCILQLDSRHQRSTLRAEVSFLPFPQREKEGNLCERPQLSLMYRSSRVLDESSQFYCFSACIAWAAYNLLANLRARVALKCERSKCKHKHGCRFVFVILLLILILRQPSFNWSLWRIDRDLKHQDDDVENDEVRIQCFVVNYFHNCFIFREFSQNLRPLSRMTSSFCGPVD